jgi:hypothetical protein
VAHWLFQGNPKYYRIVDAIKDFEQMPWLVSRYAKDMAIGDWVVTSKLTTDSLHVKLLDKPLLRVD